MSQYLKDHAIRNVWCSPEQDNQTILAATRITVPGGEVVSFPIMKRRMALPTTDRYYHVFQVGQVRPALLGLLSSNPDWKVSTWMLFSDAVESLDLFANVYNDAGVSIPLHRTYYMFTPDRALIFAVDATSRSPINYRSDRLYFRFYTNAYYESSQAGGLVYRTRAVGKTILNTADILAIQSETMALGNQPGAVFPYVNGHLVNGIDPFTTKLGDVVEYLYDASVKTIYDFKVSDLQTFVSQLDQTTKYLLHPEGRSGQIDYIDDIDVYVLFKNENKFTGRLLHKNLVSTLRMVTHRDYSLKASVYATIAQGLGEYVSETPIDLRDLTVRLYIRQGGPARDLIHDHNRIFELYKLEERLVKEAMLGVNSNVPYWTAPALEASGYCELMRVKYSDITEALVERAYGYNSISRIIGESPTKVRLSGTSLIADIPAAYINSCTVYEYSAAGLLLGVHYKELASVYYATDPLCAMVEFVVGKGTQQSSSVEGQDNLPLPGDYSYRVYMCYLVGGVPNREWVDITGGDLYHIADGKLVWNNLESDQWLQIRDDKNFLSYALELDQVAGTFYFDLAEYFGAELRLMEIPPGDLDIWFNGYSLINKLSYFVDFPRVYIVDKEKLIQPAHTEKQTVHVRCTGFCNKEMQMREPEDYGYIEHGFLSNNGRFDVRDDKVLRITVNGSLKTRDDILFSEEHQGVSIVNVLNGAPYQVKEVVVPLTWLGDEETYALREKSLTVDRAVEDYLTRVLPEPDRNAISTATSKYCLVSPFFAHIANDLANGDFPMAELEKDLSANDVLALCKPYEKLLKFDPINPENKVSRQFVVIHPTERVDAIGLSLYAYRFMQRAVELYGRDLIKLSPRIVVSLGGS